MTMKTKIRREYRAIRETRNMVDASKYTPEQGRAALAVIDIQERLAPAMPPEALAAVLRNTRILIETAKELKIPIIVTEQYPKGLGQTVPEIAAALEGVKRIEKVAFSCCGEPGFMEALKASGKRDVILCGMETHVCVLQTALGLMERDYRVFAAADAVCSRAKLNWELAIETMRQAGAVVGTAEIFAFQLLGKAGTESFKKISKMVK
jgi:nicotinamidase-related amidase